MDYVLNQDSCKYCMDCGGCDYTDTDYSKTLQIKLNDFKLLAQKMSSIPDNIEGLKTNPSPQIFNYRTRCQLHIVNGKTGFFKKKTHELIEIETCTMLDHRLNQKISELKFPANFNSKIELYIKDGKVFERLVEKKYDNLFYQVNDAVNDLMKNHVIKLLELKPNDKILELYCGQGNFTYSILKASSKIKITGIDVNTPLELQKQSLPNQNKKKKAQPGLEEAEFINSDVLRGIDVLIMQNRFNSFNKLVLDPPRSGAGIKVLEKLNKNRFEKIVYISCNPETLLSDALVLKKQGYRWISSELFDMFPFTKYTESVNIFSN